jgi:hypothetical protein
MNLFDDRRTDRLFLSQEDHRIGATIMLLLAVACWISPYFILREHNYTSSWWFAGFMVVAGLVLARGAVKAMTETVATFDGAARTLTIRRARPWRVTSDSVGFDDVLDVAAQSRMRWTAHGNVPMPETYYGIEITRAGRRRVWMYDSTETACHDMARQIMTMIRRPAARLT